MRLCVTSIAPKRRGKPCSFKKFSTTAPTSGTAFGSLISFGPRCSTIFFATFRIKIETELLDAPKAFRGFSITSFLANVVKKNSHLTLHCNWISYLGLLLLRIGPQDWNWVKKKHTHTLDRDIRKFSTHSLSATSLFKHFSHHGFVRPGFMQHDRLDWLRFLFSNYRPLREICVLLCKSIWRIWRPWSWQSDPIIINKLRNVSILSICRWKIHDYYSWFKIKTSDMNNHIRRENNHILFEICLLKIMLETKTRDLCLIHPLIHHLEVSSWANLKLLTQQLLLMISKSNIWFKAVPFYITNSYITK